MTSILATKHSSGSVSSHATNVILHAFDWPYSKVTRNAKAIANAGYKAVLVSPPYKSYRSDDGTPWWQRYQPQDYRVIDNQLGNTTDFKLMVNALKMHEIHTYADIVFNHMANESAQRTDLNYPSKKTLSEYSDNEEYFESIKIFGDLSQPLFTECDFVNAFPIKNWKDPWQVQHGRISNGVKDAGLPTLKNNKNVIKQQKSYLRALKQLGIKGFRIDAAKHMTLEHIRQIWDDDISEGVHIFGEIITDGGATKQEYELFLKPYLANTQLGAYDFPLFHTVSDVFNHNASMASLINPYSVGYALANDRAITFAITHDIPNNDVFLDQVMSEENERLAYCYVMGRDGGVPLIYTDLDTSGIKNKAGQPRWYDSWRDPILVNMIHFHNLMHGLPMEITQHSDDLLVFTRGLKGLVVINKGNKPVSIDLPEGHYCDVVGMQNVLLTQPVSSDQGALYDGGIEGYKQSLKIPAKSCAMLINNDT
ncbi:alpha-amylase [Photobacterium sagamiensis]|uniref:alpha-amylase family glycosyl hydrolase n=1 Tax=Photobacterium sagamiensis TaxID=2910241 RepID=UPI003D13BB7A